MADCMREHCLADAEVIVGLEFVKTDGEAIGGGATSIVACRPCFELFQADGVFALVEPDLVALIAEDVAEAYGCEIDATKTRLVAMAFDDPTVRMAPRLGYLRGEAEPTPRRVH